MRHLPKPPAELVGLPDWPLLMTERAAATYLSLSPEDFEKGVRHLELPSPRQTPGGPRWGAVSGPGNAVCAQGATGARKALATPALKGGARRVRPRLAPVEMAEGVISATQGALQPLIPYLDTLRWLFIGLALIGIGVTIYARLDDWKRGRR